MCFFFSPNLVVGTPERVFALYVTDYWKDHIYVPYIVGLCSPFSPPGGLMGPDSTVCLFIYFYILSCIFFV